MVEGGVRYGGFVIREHKRQEGGSVARKGNIVEKIG